MIRTTFARPMGALRAFRRKPFGLKLILSIVAMTIHLASGMFLATFSHNRMFSSIWRQSVNFSARPVQSSGTLYMPGMSNFLLNLVAIISLSLFQYPMAFGPQLRRKGDE